ncbi:MAG: dockerin type I domain-containing protein [Candidatus Bathyarchaeia archaeon]|jgi:uncharacterized repeat protein (TIGR02543 family)
MNRKLSKIISTLVVMAMLMVGLQILGLQVVTPRVKAQPPQPSLYLDPSTETFSTNTASVGTLFNVTGWIDAPDSSSGWSAGLFFDPSQLQVVTATFSGTGGKESLWMETNGIAVSSLVQEPSVWNNTDGTIGEPNGFGETILGTGLATIDVGSLFIVEFNITQAPAPGGSLSSIIQWDSLLSYGFDNLGIEEPGFNYGNCTYTFSSSVVSKQQITFAQSGLDSSASGTVVTVNGTAKTFSQLPNITSANTGDTLLFAYQTNVSSSVSGKQFVNTGVNVTSPLTVSATETVTGSYKTQYEVSFAVSPSGGGTTTPSGTNVWEDAGGLPISATPNSGFKFSNWTTTGSITLSNPSSASTTANVSSPGTITANFVSGQTFSVSFTESGLTSGTMWNVTFNGVTQSSTSDTITFSGISNGGYPYTVGIVLGYAASPASGSITVSSANVSQAITFTTAQYFLTVVTNPPDIGTPTGQGLYSAGSSAPITANQSVTIMSSISQYQFTGWTTTNMQEITSPSSPSTTVMMDGNKTVTANYVTQYYVTFNQSGVGSDFTGTVIIVDGSNYSVSSLPTSFWYNSGSTHSFAFQSPLVVVSPAKQYFWTSTTGLSTLQSATITIGGPGSVIGDYTTGAHNVVVTNITAPLWVYHGFSVNISVTVSDIGQFNESAWVIITYYNKTATGRISAYPVFLQKGQNFTLTFMWNTGTVSCHTYTLAAVVTIPSGSGTFIGGNITVRLVGDVNGDGRVDLRDIATVAMLFGQSPSSPNWNPAADINGDGVVDMKDLALIARNIGAFTTY